MSLKNIWEKQGNCNFNLDISNLIPRGVIQAPCNSSGSKAPSDSDAEERSRSTATSISKEGSTTTVAGLDCGNHTQGLAQANHGASKHQSTKENCTCAFVCLRPSDFWISRQRHGRI
ncbi:uncharacterized protein LOC119562587 [Drosophila subpulchrella]|uniref:uncharacterized protein LOC119562587 n=1 Tax=Drosophila subpulchrella TaxID=1486046 RepID=UPI0018A1A69D|nr:uncharacterized protein LOC119562587 [Drosophila subpulchrella]